MCPSSRPWPTTGLAARDAQFLQNTDNKTDNESDNKSDNKTDIESDNETDNKTGNEPDDEPDDEFDDEPDNEPDKPDTETDNETDNETPSALHHRLDMASTTVRGPKVSMAQLRKVVSSQASSNPSTVSSW